MKLKTNFDFKSLRFRLWCAFLALAIGILALIWLLQFYSLKNYYEKMKVTQVDDFATVITHSLETKPESLAKDIVDLSVKSDLYVMMESNGTLLLFTPEQDSIAPVYKYRNEIPKLKNLLQEKNASIVSYNFSTNFEQYETLAYCKLINNSDGTQTYLYIFTPLYPVQSTVSILKEQFLNVTLISLVIAFCLALFLSARITKPLKEITNGTKRMGEGDYDVKFDTNSPYSEINRLSRTLNKAAVELGRADNLQKDLIANVSHDLKTPLTLIKSYAEMIRDLSGENKVKREEHLNVILNETDRMTNLVNDMSIMSKMQNKKIEITLSEFDLSTVALELLSSFKILEEKEGYNFIFNAPKSAIVLGDKDKIKQVISNLIGNAVKYCGDNKEIIVNIKKQGKLYRFEVIDNGPGISPDEIKHIWDRYYRISKNYKRSETGSGLGLSIVKQILTLHNSEFGVESKLGAGSTFWFNIEAYKK